MTEKKAESLRVSASLQAGPPEISGTVRTFERPAEDHPTYAAVGLIASEWSHLEHVLDLLIWQLADVQSKRGACITAQIMGVPGRCKAIILLGSIKGLSEPLLKQFRKLMSDSYSVADLRARAVHDPWYVETGTDRAGQFKSMPYSEMHFGIKDVDRQKLGDDLVKIRALQDHAVRLREAAIAELSALPKERA